MVSYFVVVAELPLISVKVRLTTRKRRSSTTFHNLQWLKHENHQTIALWLVEILFGLLSSIFVERVGYWRFLGCLNFRDIDVYFTFLFFAVNVLMVTNWTILSNTGMFRAASLKPGNKLTDKTKPQATTRLLCSERFLKRSQVYRFFSLWKRALTSACRSVGNGCWRYSFWKVLTTLLQNLPLFFRFLSFTNSIDFGVHSNCGTSSF